MAVTVIQQIRQHKDARLFYLEGPTGGGKTNLSMLTTIELLQANPELNKVFYVFPFTTLITQTYAAIKETLGLQDDEIIQLHSKAGFKNRKSEETSDEAYGQDKLNYIDYLFVNYPFCLLSHIKFFDILKTNKKEANYLMHRLANSVVVVDELQSYTPQHWDKLIYFIRHYAAFFNIRFVLMSATLPKLSKLKVIQDQVDDFVYLLPEAKQDYFQNDNFRKRVNFNFTLLDKKDISLRDLANILITESKQYAEKDFGQAKPQSSVYTIIEFIYKKSASEFHLTIKALNDFFDEIFVLSGTILEHRRRHIINYLKNPENRRKRVLLITTQVVEAGVDIDMDIGFKNRSLVDSDEQLAGRINRNVNKEDCQLFLFNRDEAGVLYGNDKRYKVTQKQLKTEDYQEILRDKNFDKLYDLVFQDINGLNVKKMMINFEDYEKDVKKMNFQSVHEKFKLIDQDNLSVFVPLAVPLEVDGSTPDTREKVFSDQELYFLKQANILPNSAHCIEGEEVFGLYSDLINNRRTDFTQQQVSMKTIQGIISKFVFSVFDDKKGKMRNNLISYADTEKFKSHNNENNDGLLYGFVYLSHYQDVYDETFGLNESAFDSVENCIL